MTRLGKGAKAGIAIGVIAAAIVIVLAALMISVAVREAALRDNVTTKKGSVPNGDIDVKLVAADIFSTKIIQQRTIAFAEGK